MCDAILLITRANIFSRQGAAHDTSQHCTRLSQRVMMHIPSINDTTSQDAAARIETWCTCAGAVKAAVSSPMSPWAASFGSGSSNRLSVLKHLGLASDDEQGAATTRCLCGPGHLYRLSDPAPSYGAGSR